jgi:hypothetical protein
MRTRGKCICPQGVARLWTRAAHSGGQTITWKAGAAGIPLYVREGAMCLAAGKCANPCDANYVTNGAIVAAKQDLTFLIYPGSDMSVHGLRPNRSVPLSGAARLIMLNSIARPVVLQVSGAEPAEVTVNGPSCKNVPQLRSSTRRPLAGVSIRRAGLFSSSFLTSGLADVRC